MPDFFFRPATIEIPRKSEASGFDWQYIDNPVLCDAIDEEVQHVRFLRNVLEQLRHTEDGRVDNPSYEMPLGLTLRAGFIRSTILYYTSIAEAVLLHHAERRGYGLPKKKTAWTFGQALKAWKGKPDVKLIWSDLEKLQSIRNQVHLLNKATSADSYFNDILKQEKQLFEAAERVLEALKGFKSERSASAS